MTPDSYISREGERQAFYLRCAFSDVFLAVSFQVFSLILIVVFCLDAYKTYRAEMGSEQGEFSKEAGNLGEQGQGRKSKLSPQHLQLKVLSWMVI